MNKLLVPAIAGMAVFPLLAYAAAPLPHIRGTVASVSADTLTVHTDGGANVTVKLTPNTHYVKVLKSSLSAIDKNSFIGTATKNIGSKLVALEVVVFPESMRGAGEGHYSWDKLPDTTLGGGTKVASTMTNGTVTTETSPKSAPMVNTTMTNGTVATDTKSGGTKELTVTYKGGKQQILVPPTAPIVTLALGTKADVTQGAAVVVTEAKGSDNALSVAVGIDGVKPPM